MSDVIYDSIGLVNENFDGVGVWFEIPFGKSTVQVWLINEDSDEFDNDGIFMPSPYRTKIHKSGFVELIMPSTLGFMELFIPNMGAGYVAHELTHALLHYKTMIDEADNFGAGEEHYCLAMDEATVTLWNKYYEYLTTEVKNAENNPEA